jgi:hypothetical protein
MMCVSCRFWGLHHDNYSGTADCRRFPPIGSKSHPRGGTSPVWPRTQNTDYCGEFKEKTT